MNKLYMLLVCITIGLVNISHSAAESKSKSRIDYKELSSSIKHSVNRTRSLEVFGESLRRVVLEAAAKDVAKGKLTGTVNVNLTYRVAPSKTPPSPTEVNVCWEICFSRQCYIECEAPKVIEH